MTSEVPYAFTGVAVDASGYAFVTFERLYRTGTAIGIRKVSPAGELVWSRAVNFMYNPKVNAMAVHGSVLVVVGSSNALDIDGDTAAAWVFDVGSSQRRSLVPLVHHIVNFGIMGSNEAVAVELTAQHAYVAASLYSPLTGQPAMSFSVINVNTGGIDHRQQLVDAARSKDVALAGHAAYVLGALTAFQNEGPGDDVLFKLEMADSDSDGVADGCDNCVNAANPTQADYNANGKGDACDPAPAPKMAFDVYFAFVREDTVAGSVVQLFDANLNAIARLSATNGTISMQSEFFALDQNGQLVTTTDLDYEDTEFYALQLTAETDLEIEQPPPADYAQLLVTVLDANDHAPVLNNMQASIPANSPPGTIIAQLNATDVDTHTDLTYRAIGVNNPTVTVDPHSGVIISLITFTLETLTKSLQVLVTDGKHNATAIVTFQVVPDRSCVGVVCTPFDNCHPNPVCSGGVCSPGAINASNQACLAPTTVCQCPASSAGGVSWPTALCGEQRTAPCPGANRAGLITRLCQRTGVYAAPVSAACVYLPLLNLATTETIANDDIEEATQTLADATTDVRRA